MVVYNDNVFEKVYAYKSLLILILHNVSLFPTHTLVLHSELKRRLAMQLMCNKLIRLQKYVSLYNNCLDWFRIDLVSEVDNKEL